MLGQHHKFKTPPRIEPKLLNHEVSVKTTRPAKGSWQCMAQQMCHILFKRELQFTINLDNSQLKSGTGYSLF